MAAATWLTGRTRAAKLFFGSVLLLILIATRWAWIDCDGGVPTLNEYGYFATDEGYYCGGGKMKLLRGKFVSAVRASPCTYAVCPSTHIMTWWSFLLFGQTTWAHRVFPMLICSGAWLTAFALIARRTLPWIAFLLCACCALNPFLVVYGRTACNDTLMGSLLLIGYAVTSGRHRLRPLAGGLVFGLGLWVKMSIWALFPLGLAAAALTPVRAARARRLGLFLLGFIGSACAQYGLIRLLIAQDAAEQDVTVSRLLELSDSSYPLPNLLDWRLVLRALSSFPRCPGDGLLSLWSALFLVLPVLLLLRRLAERPFRWDGRLLLYAALPLYAAGIILLPVYYAHYYIPVMMFVPLVWLEARRDLKRWGGSRPLLGAVLLAAALLGTALAYRAFIVHPDQATGLTNFICNAYNLPASIVWSRNGWHIAAAAAALGAMALAAQRRRLTPLLAAAALLSALVVADLCFSTIPLCEAHKYTPIFSRSIREVASVLQAGSILLFFAVWVLPAWICRNVRWHLLFAALFLSATLANPVWRSALPELTRRGRLHKQAAAELARLIPKDAVVFGERAPQLFLSLQPRVSAVPNQDPVPVVLAVHEKLPDAPLYALLDSEHNYHFTHYENNKDKIQMQVLHTLKLPSFNTGLPSNVFLVQLRVIDPKESP